MDWGDGRSPDPEIPIGEGFVHVFFAGTGRCPTGFMEFQISPEDLLI